MCLLSLGWIVSICTQTPNPFSALLFALGTDPKRQFLPGSLAVRLVYTKIPPLVETASRSGRTEFYLLWIFGHSDLRGILIHIRHFHLLILGVEGRQSGTWDPCKNTGERMPRREVRDVDIRTHISNKKTVDSAILTPRAFASNP